MSLDSSNIITFELMLLKNIYILYPAGYSGTFLNWSISSSCSLSIVNDPMNTNDSLQYGGVGTAHQHTKIPTHQSIKEHLAWCITNRPNDKRIYCINTNDYNLSATLDAIARTDSDPCIIIIHNNNDYDTTVYGWLNCLLKWPVYLHLNLRASEIRNTTLGINYNAPTWNYQDLDNIDLRNDIALNKLFLLNVKLSPVTEHNRAAVEVDHTEYLDWYAVRHQHHPHEVNLDYYISKPIDWQNVYQISCKDIVLPGFVDWLEHFFSVSQVVDRYDTSVVTDTHKKYVSMQHNAQWEKEIDHWRSTGHLSKFLLGHQAIQGFVLKDMFDSLKINTSAHEANLEWKKFYNNVKDPSWTRCDFEEDFLKLDAKIQKELTEVFAYKFRPDCVGYRKKLKFLEWVNEPDLTVINQWYQAVKND